MSTDLIKILDMMEKFASTIAYAQWSDVNGEPVTMNGSDLYELSELRDQISDLRSELRNQIRDKE